MTEAEAKALYLGKLIQVTVSGTRFVGIVENVSQDETLREADISIEWRSADGTLYGWGLDSPETTFTIWEEQP